MAMADDAIVTEMANTYVSPGAQLVEMEFKNSDGTHQILRFSPSKMMGFIRKVLELFLNEKIGKDSRHGRADAQAFPAVTTYAEEDTAKKTALLHFRLRSGIPVVLSLSLSNAEGLHQQIGEALKRIKKPS
jgi:hypothetical protein